MTAKSFLKTLADAPFASILLLALIVVWFGAFGLTTTNVEHHFALLAQSLLNGVTSVDAELHTYPSDFTLYQGKASFPWGPLPALFFMPSIVLFGKILPISYVGLILNLTNALLLYRIAALLGYRTTEQKILVVASFIFGSAYIGISTLRFSAWFSQVVAVTFLLASINEHLGKRRLWRIGLFLACATLTRSVLALASAFFLVGIWFEGNRTLHKHVLKRGVSLLLPIMIAVGILAAYNYSRYGDITESGHSYIIHTDSKLPLVQDGIFSPTYIPRNLYYLFLKLPDVRSLDEDTASRIPTIDISPWGLSIFITSPYLLALALHNRRGTYFAPALIASLVLLVPISMFFDTGSTQFGARYSLDFFPFLFLGFLEQQGGIFSTNMKRLLYACIVINLILFGVFWLFRL